MPKAALETVKIFLSESKNLLYVNKAGTPLCICVSCVNGLLVAATGIVSFLIKFKCYILVRIIPTTDKTRHYV